MTPPWLAFDEMSLLVHTRGETSLRAIEESLREKNCTLNLASAELEQSVRTWIDNGLIGATAVADDPVRQHIAGLSVRSGNEIVSVKPAPRRAVGPDWIGAVIGARGILGIVEEAWISVQKLKPHEVLVFTFKEDFDARASLAHMRGHGARLAHSDISQKNGEFMLVVSLAGDSRHRAVCADVVRACARARGGYELSAAAAPAKSPPTTTVLSPSEPLQRIAQHQAIHHSREKS